MKNQFYYAILLVVLLVASCVNDGAGAETGYDPEAVWEYDGDVAVLNKVIKELENGSNGKKLESMFLKNDVLWEESKFLFIDNKKRILVPFLSKDRNTVQGVLSLAKDADGKTTFNITDRYLSMRENSPLPFWDSGTWLGYIMALDKDILGKENGNPGVATKIAKNHPKNVLTMRMECSTQMEEIVFYTYNYVLSSSGEVTNFSYSETRSEYTYKTVCYDVPDPIPVPVPNTGGTPAPAPAPNNILKIFNYLEGKALCIYNKLNISSSGFANAIKKFDGEFPVSHLTFIINNNLPSGNYGVTNPPSNYNITIELSNTQLANISDLGGAIAIAHEIVHAEIFRKLLSAAQKGDLNTNNYTTQENINYVNSLRNNFPGLYDYYYSRVHPTWNHDLMAQHYRSTIADIAQQFDNSALPRQVYEDLAWAGLRTIESNVNSIAWNNLSSTEKQRIMSNLTNKFHNGTKNCN